jgi:hypothetical protein
VRVGPRARAEAKQAQGDRAGHTETEALRHNDVTLLTSEIEISAY